MNSLFTMLSLPSLFLSNSRLITNEYLFCMMETKLHQKSNSFAETIDINNLCNHFRGNLREDCLDFYSYPLKEKDSSICFEYLDYENIKNISQFQDKWSHFIDFMTDYKKIYENELEVQFRFDIFNDNLEWIHNHNLDKSHTYNVGVNRFADMSHNEYKEYVKRGSGYSDFTNLRGLTLPKDMCGTMKSQSGSFPSSIDWRTKNVVTPVRDQGQQGTCYAHAASENVESVYAIKYNTLPNLSVQQIVDCSYSYGDHGNNGGMYTYAWTYIHDSGLTTESAYPYTAGDSDRSSCKAFTPYTYVSDCNHVPENELQLTYAVVNQPVSVAIEADSRSFQLYTSGVYNDPSCGTTIDHAVVAVGYGTLNGQDYWTVRNSWGTSWGQDGYILIARNSVSSSTIGQCAIATYAAYPIV